MPTTAEADLINPSRINNSQEASEAVQLLSSSLIAASEKNAGDFLWVQMNKNDSSTSIAPICSSMELRKKYFYCKRLAYHLSEGKMK